MAAGEMLYRGAYLDIDNISDHHKIWIVQEKMTVIGYIGEGTTREIVSNWDMPFADTSLESKFRQGMGLIQAGTGMTSFTKLHSRQVWAGNQPYTFNLAMKFRAITSESRGLAGYQVEEAIRALELMMAPDLQAGVSVAGQDLPSLNSRVPLPVTINVGRQVILTECIIRSMSTAYDKEKDSSGKMIRADVSLQVETLNALTRADLKASFENADKS
jgi:hypothetical protein